MQNDRGENVDLYIPRKCSWTNRLITSQDKGSVQINIAHVDPKTGLYTGKFTPFALSGYIRSKVGYLSGCSQCSILKTLLLQGEGDLALTSLVDKMPADTTYQN